MEWETNVRSSCRNLAELLAKEDGEDYSDVVMSLRTMLSFQVLRAAVLCVRGSRRVETMGIEHLQT